MNSLKQDFLQTLKITVLALLISFGVTYIHAEWAPNSGSPTDNNAAAPITTGDGQIKQGGLTVAAREGTELGFAVLNGKVGIGTTDPASKLDVNGDVSATAFHLVGGDNYPGFDFIPDPNDSGWVYAPDQITNNSWTVGTLKAGGGGHSGEICLNDACIDSWPAGSGSSYYVKQTSYKTGGVGSVSCNAGDIAVGGGISQGATETSNGNWSVAQNRPVMTGDQPTGWYCAGEAGQGRCYAICLNAQ